MLKSHHRQLFALLITFDLVIVGGIYLALLMTPQLSGLTQPLRAERSVWLVFLGTLFLWPVAAQTLDLYESARTRHFLSLAARPFVVAMCLGFLSAALAFMLSAPLAPTFPIYLAAALGLFLTTTRVAIYIPLKIVRSYGKNTRNVLIVGTGPRGAEIKRQIDEHPEWGLCLIGFVDDEATAIDPSLFNAKIYDVNEMASVVHHQVVDRVVIAYPRSMLTRLSVIVEVCASAGIPFTMLTDLFGDHLPAPRTTHLGSLTTLEFAPVHHNTLALVAKRGVDVVGALAGLIFATPLIVVSALAIKLHDGGPVLFKQVRCGLNGRRFEMFKMRTMCIDAPSRQRELREINDAAGPIFKMRNDPRVTPVGRLLRRYSLDELPQLWNILRGDMSLVGPRPPVPEEVDHYKTSERRRLSMRPGLTCIWQVSGRSEIGFERWVKLDCEYIDSWSLLLDAKILLKTIPAVLKGEGAF